MFGVQSSLVGQICSSGVNQSNARMTFVRVEDNARLGSPCGFTLAKSALGEFTCCKRTCQAHGTAAIGFSFLGVSL